MFHEARPGARQKSSNNAFCSDFASAVSRQRIYVSFGPIPRALSRTAPSSFSSFASVRFLSQPVGAERCTEGNEANEAAKPKPLLKTVPLAGQKNSVMHPARPLTPALSPDGGEGASRASGICGVVVAASRKSAARILALPGNLEFAALCRDAATGVATVVPSSYSYSYSQNP